MAADVEPQLQLLGTVDPNAPDRVARTRPIEIGRESRLSSRGRARSPAGRLCIARRDPIPPGVRDSSTSRTPPALSTGPATPTGAPRMPAMPCLRDSARALRSPRRGPPALVEDRQLRPKRQRLPLHPRAPDQARAPRPRQPDLRGRERTLQRDSEQAQGRPADAGATGRALTSLAGRRAREGTPTCIAASTIPTHVSVASATWTHTISAGSSSWNCAMPTMPCAASRRHIRVSRVRRSASAPARRASHQVATASTPRARPGRRGGR